MKQELMQLVHKYRQEAAALDVTQVVQRDTLLRAANDMENIVRLWTI